MTPLVLGLTGPNAAGKGEVAAWLERLGFVLHSLSDIVREEAAARGLPPEREHLIRVGNELRQAGGAGVLAERLLPRLGARAVVDSIRNPAEVQVLRRLPAFRLVGIVAPVELRFRRSLERCRAGDPRSLEEFRARERQENSADPTGQRLDATLALADRVVENSGDRAALHRSLDRLLAELELG
ncbi:MAG TPA: AAA family ATPase [Candidatus Polarisedimenticolaceae bacterium]|nr:AAA family ATPase [Candidatus Polarisedimenticolaceae bacterium]